MFNFIVADAWSSEGLWAWYCAQSAVSDAVAALEDAGTALTPLVADSEWHSKGVTALHELIVDMAARAASEVSALEDRLREIKTLATA